MSDLERDEIDWDKNPVLVNKERENPPHLDAKSIGEMLAEQMELDYMDLTGCDDTSDVEKAILAIDFSDVDARLWEAVKDIYYYTQSDIKLVP